MKPSDRYLLDGRRELADAHTLELTKRPLKVLGTPRGDLTVMIPPKASQTVHAKVTANLASSHPYANDIETIRTTSEINNHQTAKTLY